MRKRTIPFIILTLLLWLSPACRFSSQASATPTPPGLPIGESLRNLAWAGRERSYILYVPASVNWNQPVPVVFVFHGGTGNAGNAMLMTGFNQVADQHGFLLVYPNGTSRLSEEKLLTWNGGACCGYAQEKNVDDVGFVRTIVTALQAQVNLDSRRIYATGFSNGAILSQRLACEAADLFAAIAPVSGTLNFSPCQPSRPVSVIEFHGSADQNILYTGGYGPKSLAK
jgi:polyhydroxybutyrate depolymerase